MKNKFDEQEFIDKAWIIRKSTIQTYDFLVFVSTESEAIKKVEEYKHTDKEDIKIISVGSSQKYEILKEGKGK